jgi:hypothetical protein
VQLMSSTGVTVKRHRRVVLRAGIQLAERAMVDSTMLYVRYLRNWRGRDRGMVFFNAANFASCRQAKEIVGFGYSDSAVASDLEIFAAERAGNAKLVAELGAKREAAINAYMASMLVGRRSPHVLPVQPLDQRELERLLRPNGPSPHAPSLGRGVPTKPAGTGSASVVRDRDRPPTGYRVAARRALRCAQTRPP